MNATPQVRADSDTSKMLARGETGPKPFKVSIEREEEVDGMWFLEQKDIAREDRADLKA
jgi:hypothetical protein